MSVTWATPRPLAGRECRLNRGHLLRPICNPAACKLTLFLRPSWRYVLLSEAVFIGGFLFFLAFVTATEHHQNPVVLRPALLVGFFLAGLMLPLKLAIIPLFIQLTSMGLVDTRLGLVIVYTAMGLPSAVCPAAPVSVPIKLENCSGFQLESAPPFESSRRKSSTCPMSPSVACRCVPRPSSKA